MATGDGSTAAGASTSISTRRASTGATERRRAITPITVRRKSAKPAETKIGDEVSLGRVRCLRAGAVGALPSSNAGAGDVLAMVVAAGTACGTSCTALDTLDSTSWYESP